MFHSFVVTKRSSRRSVPAPNVSCIASPTASSICGSVPHNRNAEIPPQGGLGRLFGRKEIGDQRAEPGRRDRTGSVGESNFRVAKRVGRADDRVLRSVQSRAAAMFDRYNSLVRTERRNFVWSSNNSYLVGLGLRSNSTGGLTSSIAIIRTWNWPMTATTAARSVTISLSPLVRRRCHRPNVPVSDLVAQSGFYSLSDLGPLTNALSRR